MIRGLYTSALGMTTQMSKMDVVTNNIANVNTVGYKKDTVVTRAFEEELMYRLNDKYSEKSTSTIMNKVPRVGDVSQGVFVDQIFTNFANGSTITTKGDLDFALVGDGFFAVRTANQNGDEIERYTRDGSFALAPDGTLITKDGNPVLGENGNIVLPNGKVAISPEGDIYVNEQLIDRLRLVSFEDNTTLRKFGNNLYDANEATGAVLAGFNGMVLQGELENSNVNAVKEMVDVITVSRTYEANQRMISIHDMILGKTVNDVGRK